MNRSNKWEPARTAVKSVFSYPAEQSVGHQVRWAHRALQREIESRVRPHGITLGMLYFLRGLWEEDGLSQWELSECIGASELTTVTALRAMEKCGLAIRVQDTGSPQVEHLFHPACKGFARIAVTDRAGGQSKSDHRPLERRHRNA